jgi:DNA-directed RNA polymerase subunit RPC12/RpoP
MAQFFSNPKRETAPYAMPDAEAWRAEVYRFDCETCGDMLLHEGEVDAATDGVQCPSCQGNRGTLVRTGEKKWWAWFCFPGCMPESEPFGPFDSEKQAIDYVRDLEDVREWLGDEEPIEEDEA